MSVAEVLDDVLGVPEVAPRHRRKQVVLVWEAFDGFLRVVGGDDKPVIWLAARSMMTAGLCPWQAAKVVPAGERHIPIMTAPGRAVTGARMPCT